MADPLTALMYAVQVMNFLRTLIEKTLREREDHVIEQASALNTEPSGDNGHETYSRVDGVIPAESIEETMQQAFVVDDPGSQSGTEANQINTITDDHYNSYSSSTEESDGGESCETPGKVINGPLNESQQSSNSTQMKSESRIDDQQAVEIATKLNKGLSNLSRINSITERCEAWR